MKKEVKEFQLKMRVSKTEKEQIVEYCKNHKMTISDLLRLSVSKFLDKNH